MTIEADAWRADNKELVRYVFEAGFERGDLDALAARVASDYVVHEVPSNTPRGPAGMISVVQGLRLGRRSVSAATAPRPSPTESTK